MIDIIIPTYNRPAYLSECVASIRAAAERVSESVGIIVVDDGSETDAAEVIASLMGARYIRHERNRGVGQALATGWQASTADYTAFFGDDDIMLPHWFERHLELAYEGFDVVSSSYFLVGPTLQNRRPYILPRVTVADLMADTVTVNDGSLLRRAAVPGFRPERERAMMMTLWLAMAHAGASFATINEPCWLYRRHAHNLSRPPIRRDQRFAALRIEAIAEYR